MKFVFLHIPKTAGTSLKAALDRRVGKTNIYADYLRPFAEPAYLRNTKAAWHAATHTLPAEPYIYGHFVNLKYLQWRGYGFRPYPHVRYATFVREPLERAVSHFVHWKNFPQPKHAMWHVFNREQWTIEKFLLSPYFANFHAQYMYGMHPTQYAAIGVLERMDESMALYADRFPEFVDLDLPQLRVSPHNKPEVVADLDPAVIALFRRMNATDYRIYVAANAQLDRFAVTPSSR
jgi:hypothetical protein